MKAKVTSAVLLTPNGWRDDGINWAPHGVGGMWRIRLQVKPRNLPTRVFELPAEGVKDTEHWTPDTELQLTEVGEHPQIMVRVGDLMALLEKEGILAELEIKGIA